MKDMLVDDLLSENHLGCFGRFSIEDSVCKNLCALRLRCSTDHEQNDRLELLEELVSADTMFMRIQ
ncbi:MAG: hypothetical protein V3S89_14720 [Desulfobacterales bacterium]